MSRKIKVLVVEDSSLVRKIIVDILESDPLIEVVGTANNGKTAIYRNNVLEPDVITMDIEMPIMDGLEALQQIIKTKPRPVIMMSVLTQHGTEATFKALEYGAIDFIPKPSSNVSLSVNEIADLLIGKVKSVYDSNIKIFSKKETKNLNIEDNSHLEEQKSGVNNMNDSEKIIAIGTSTGGPQALSKVFKGFPEKFPFPVMVVQHMPEGFTSSFAERLNNNSNLTVKEAEDNEEILPGFGYIAPGHSHVAVEDHNGTKVIKIFKGEKVSGHMPSIDVLFDSISKTYGKKSICVIMTGMGRDGSEGILQVKKGGGYTIAQDEDSSVVFGMNRVAVELGAIQDVVPLEMIYKKIVEQL